MRNHDFLTSAVAFARYGLHAHGLGGASVGPCYGEHDDDDEACKLFGIGDVGVLDIETTGLGVTEQALDAPPPSVVVERLLRVGAVCGDDQPFAVSKAFCGKTGRFARGACRAVDAPLADEGCASGPPAPQERGKRPYAAVIEGDGHVDLHADGEGDIVFIEEIHPFGADELAVGEQAADGGGGKQHQIAPHQRDAVAPCRSCPDAAAG